MSLLRALTVGAFGITIFLAVLVEGVVFRCCSMRLTRIAFQACSLNHSDISPL
jgi:hypothetical protein